MSVPMRWPPGRAPRWRQFVDSAGGPSEHPRRNAKKQPEKAMKTTGMLLVAAVALGGLAVAPAPAAAKDWSSVTIALEGSYEPWNLTRPDGTIDGFEPELAKALCAHMHVRCRLIAQDWDGMIAAMNAGKFDAIMDALSITPDREKVIAFSIPYANTPASFVATKDSPLAKLPATGTTIKLTGDVEKAKADPAIQALQKALAGKTIGIQTATVYSTFIYGAFKDVATIKEYKTAAEHDLDLNAGRIDVAFDDSTYFTSAFAKPDNKDLAFTGPQIGGTVWGQGEAVGLRKSDADLKALFDAAITAALADGTVKTLSEKWFKTDVSP
jgi:octopine/nopaline transport system substrate-binding protein